MAQRVVLFTEDEARIIDSHIMRGRDRPQYVLPVKKRRKLVGGGGACTGQFVIMIQGRPTAGTVSIPVTVSGTTESVVINYNAGGTAPSGFGGSSQAYLNLALATHSLITVDDVVVTTPGGTLPYMVLRFAFTGNVSTSDVTIGNQTDSLTGGSSPYSMIDYCCG